jgi:hypothetical protein
VGERSSDTEPDVRGHFVDLIVRRFMKNSVNCTRFDIALSAVVFLFTAHNVTINAQMSSAPVPLQELSQTSSEPLVAKLEVASSSSSQELPDAPSAQVDPSNEQSDEMPPKPRGQVRINPIPLLSPRLISGIPVTAHDKFEIYIHKAYSPAAVIYPLFGAGIKMARPNKDYPDEWQDGIGAFGRNYGDAAARRTAKTTAEYATQVLLQEDPRYQRSDSKNPVIRIGHAVGWTLFDKSDSGHRRLAYSTFTSAAAGSFVGMAYLPDGFNTATKAQQRMLGQVGSRAIGNVLVEFEPLWGPVARKIRIPRILPEWWTPEHR